MTIKEAFEYLSSECGIGMKNPFIALRNLVEAFGKVADEIDTSGDYVKKSGDTMTGPLTVEGDVTAQEVTAAVFKFEEPVLGGSISFTGVPGLEQVGIQVPNKSGTMVLSSTVENYTTAEHVVGRWIDGSKVYERTWEFENAITANSNSWTDTPISNDTIKGIIGVKGYNINSGKISCWNGLSATADSGAIVKIIQNRDAQITIKYLTLQYIKTT